jgi:hypothetical protein
LLGYEQGKTKNKNASQNKRQEKQKMLPPRRGAGGAKVKKHKITGGLLKTKIFALLPYGGGSNF